MNRTLFHYSKIDEAINYLLKKDEKNLVCNADLIDWKANVSVSVYDDTVGSCLTKDKSREKHHGIDNLNFPRVATKQQKQDLQHGTLFNAISPATSSRHLHPFLTSIRKLGVNVIIHGVVSYYQNAYDKSSSFSPSLTEMVKMHLVYGPGPIAC